MNTRLHYDGGWDWTSQVAPKLPLIHAVTCRHGGDVVIWHNLLRDAVADLCHKCGGGVGAWAYWGS